MVYMTSDLNRGGNVWLFKLPVRRYDPTISSQIHTFGRRLQWARGRQRAGTAAPDPHWLISCVSVTLVMMKSRDHQQLERRKTGQGRKKKKCLGAAASFLIRLLPPRYRDISRRINNTHRSAIVRPDSLSRGHWHGFIVASSSLATFNLFILICICIIISFTVRGCPPTFPAPLESNERHKNVSTFLAVGSRHSRCTQKITESVPPSSFFLSPWFLKPIDNKRATMSFPPCVHRPDTMRTERLASCWQKKRILIYLFLCYSIFFKEEITITVVIFSCKRRTKSRFEHEWPDARRGNNKSCRMAGPAAALVVPIKPFFGTHTLSGRLGFSISFWRCWTTKFCRPKYVYVTHFVALPPPLRWIFNAQGAQWKLRCGRNKLVSFKLLVN